MSLARDLADLAGEANGIGNSITANSSAITAISVGGENLSPVQSFRNKIINGNFDIWQRGTSGTNSGYLADRWQNNIIGSSASVSRQPFAIGQTDVPGEPTYFMRQTVTSVAGAANVVNVAQRIESVRTLAGQTATLSFWAKADSSKNIAVTPLHYFGTGGSPSSSYYLSVTTCALTTSWQKFTITFNYPSISGKTIGTNNDDFIGVWFWFDAGSNYDSSTNSLGQQSGTFDIAQVQLEAGSVATPFEQRPIGTEFALCQRYYHRTMVHMQSPSAGPMLVPIYFPVQMRATPTSTNISAGSTGGGASSIVLSVRDTRSGYFQFVASASSNYYIDRIDAYDAEL